MENLTKEKTIRLLLVEQREVAQSIFGRALRHTGTEFHVAAFPAIDRAFHELRRRTAFFDVIVCEHRPPDCDAFEFFERLRSAGIETPIVMFAHAQDPTLVMNAIRAGVDECVCETAEANSLDVLPLVVERALNRYRERRDLKRSEHQLRVHQIELETQNVQLKETEQQLQTANERLHDLYEFAPVGYITLDERDVIVEANLTSEDLFSIDRSRLVGAPLARFLSRESRIIWRNHRSVINEDTTPCEVCIESRQAGGARFERWCEVRSEPVQCPGVSTPHLRTILIDITSRKQAQAEARDRELSFRGLLDGLPSAAYTCAQDGTITDYNQMAAALWGRKPKLNNPVDRYCGSFKLYTPNGEPIRHSECCMAKAMRRRNYTGEHFVVERPNGERRHVLAHASPLFNDRNEIIGAVNVLVDVTELHQIQRSLRIRERAIAASTHGVIITDALQPDHPIIYCNPAFERMTGYSTDEVIGRNCRFLQNDDRDQPSIHELRRAIHDGRGGMFLIRNYKKDKTLFWNEVTITPVQEENGQVTHFVGLQHDVTQRVESENRLLRFNEDLQKEVQRRTEELANSEQRYRSLTEAITSIVFVSAPDGRLITPQPLWRDYTGQTSEESADFGWLDGVHPDDVDTIRQAVKDLRDSPRFYETSARVWNAASRTHRHGDIRVVPIFNDDGSTREFVVTFTDVHDQVLAETALHETNVRLREAQRIGKIGNWEWTIATGEVFWSLEMYHLYGQDSHVFEPNFESVVACMPPEDQLLVQRNLEATLDGSDEDAASYQHRVIWRDGSIRYHDCRYRVEKDAQGAPRFVVGTSQDVTSRIEQERELRESEERLRLITNAVPAIISYVDRNETYQFANLQFEQLMGVGIGELIGKTAVEVMGRKTYAARKPFIDRALSGEATTSEIDLSFPSRPIQHSQVSYIPHIDKGVVQGFYVLVVDLSEREADAKKLAAHQQALNHMGRIHVAGEMAASIAHEINQPLQSITLQSEICTRKLQGDLNDGIVQDAVAALRDITQQSHRAGNIVNFLRRFVRNAEPRQSAHDLNEIVRVVLSTIERKTRDAKIEIATRFAPLARRVLVDQIQIEQVILNFIQNAIDASKRLSPADKLITIGTRTASTQTVELWVRDRGCGVSGDINQIFESYYTTKPDGIGLGLAICRSIVEAHNGRIWATCNAEQGITVHMEIPSHSDDILDRN